MAKRLLALTTALFVAASGGCSRVSAHLERAQELTFKQDFKAAALEYQALLLELGHDESASAREARASSLRALADLNYLHMNDYSTAARLYRDLAERYPEHPLTFDARAQLADILRDHFHDTRAALAQLAALVQSFPNHLDTDRYQYRAAQDYFSLQDYAQTETELKLLLGRFPGSGLRTDAQMLLAASIALQGRRAEAIELYNKIALEHPGADAARAYLEIGRLYEETNEYDKAETAMARALADHPEPKIVAAALQRIRRRVALKRPADIHDRAAIFDHKIGGQNVADRGGD